jgi:predicted RNA-binding Zn-ribbon protein involved in translation (DUF1610 family)
MMESDQSTETTSIYEWLCCPNCDSRDIIRGPRNERGAVELRCRECETSGWVAL